MYHNKSSILTMSLMFAETMSNAGRYRIKDKLEGIDIKKEYHLIQYKKSALPRSLRDIVVYRYESNQRGKRNG